MDPLKQAKWSNRSKNATSVITTIKGIWQASNISKSLASMQNLTVINLQKFNVRKLTMTWLTVIHKWVEPACGQTCWHGLLRMKRHSNFLTNISSKTQQANRSYDLSYFRQPRLSAFEVPQRKMNRVHKRVEFSHEVRCTRTISKSNKLQQKILWSTASEEHKQGDSLTTKIGPNHSQLKKSNRLWCHRCMYKLIQ